MSLEEKLDKLATLCELLACRNAQLTELLQGNTIALEAIVDTNKKMLEEIENG